MKLLALSVLVFSLCVTLPAQFIRVEGRQFVQPDGRPYFIKGTNLGNWLVPEGYMWRLKGGPQSPREIETLVALLLGPDRAATFWQTWRDRYVTEADLTFIARTGANTVRVPLHYKFFLEPNGEGFRRLDQVVAWSRRASLHLILDLHCAPGGQTGTNIDDSLGYPWLFDSPSAQAQLLSVWQNLARHYRDESVILGYDLLNEPLPGYPGWEKYKPTLEPLFHRVLAAVREIDPHHVVFLTGAHWDSDFSILGAPPAANLAYTVHKYWMPPVEDSLRPYLDFRAKHNVPLYLGETGENNDAWVGDFRRLLEAQDIGWTFWPYKKMESTAGFVRFAPPRHWAKVVEFAAALRTTGSNDVKAALPLRPSAAEVDETFADLLNLIELAHGEPNRGYLEALGLTVPAGN